MRLSLRTMLELASTGILIGLLVWKMLTLASVRADLEAAHVATANERTHRVAAEMSHESCKSALLQVGEATAALRTATQSAYAAVDEALSVAQTRRQTTSAEVARLLAVRPGANDDCAVAKDLAQGAWRDKQ